MFDQGLLDRVRGAFDIGALVGEYVPLKKAGSHSLKGLCPFHQEKTPSFHVNTSMQIFKCFGCQAGGNAITFFARIENLSFPEAVRRLAERARIPLPESSTPEERERQRLLQILESTAAMYQKTLRSSPAAAAARTYLNRRGLDETAVERFRFGYSTGREIFASGVHQALLVRAGLASPGRGGEPYDRMRGRLVIPIHDEDGRVIAFGGRALDDHQVPKYLNSPETALYKKSHSLFALHQAREAIRKAQAAVLVEGYFDAIAAHAHGVRHTVAVLGTSLTEPQLKLLKRFARALFIVYDEDVGGNAAAVRGLDLATEAGFQVKIVRLPGNTDPDELLRARGADGFLRCLEEAAGGEAPADALQERGVAVSLFDFRLEVAARGNDATSIEGKQAILAGVLPFLAKVPSAIERHAYLKRLADKLELREKDLDEELQRYRTGHPTPPGESRRHAPADVPAKPGQTWRAERLLLVGALGHRAEAVNALLQLPVEAFAHTASAALARRLKERLEAGEPFSVASLMDEFHDSPVVLELLASAEDGGEGPTEPACREAARHLEQRMNRSRLRDLQHQLERASDPATVSRLLAEKLKLARADLR